MEKVIKASVWRSRFRPLFLLARFALLVSGCGDPGSLPTEDPTVVADEGEAGSGPAWGDADGSDAPAGDASSVDHPVEQGPYEPTAPADDQKAPARRPPRVSEPFVLGHAYPDHDDVFGYSVAVSVDTVVVGVPGDDSHVDGTDVENGIYGDPSHNMHATYDSGAIYVYDLEGNETAYLKPLDFAPQDRTTKTLGWGDRVGTSVAIDGDIVVAGAPGWEDDAGKAYVFERDWTTRAWRQTGQLVPEASSPGGLFGQSVAVAGETIVVGAPKEDGELRDSGAAYVFERVDGYWRQVARLEASNLDAYDEFGTSVAITNGFIAVGSPFEDSGESDGPFVNDASSAGATYVFERTSEGWSFPQYIKDDRPSAGDHFGASVAIHALKGAGTVRLAVGAPGADLGRGGAVSIFQPLEESDGDWTRTAQLYPGSHGEHQRFGHSIALDGDYLVVGAPGENTWAEEDIFQTSPPSEFPTHRAENSGAIYVYKHDSRWEGHGFLKAHAYVDGFLGTSVGVEAESFALVAGQLMPELAVPSRAGAAVISPLSPPRLNSGQVIPPTGLPGGGQLSF